jgi:hypothetical protein
MSQTGDEVKERDLRNALAKARDAYLSSEYGQASLSGTASGVYLRNRVEHAFIAGWDAATQSMKATTP